ncbi:uncharacterized protein K452DRAFT_330380 [Aplosporella prunicola CBS 121167]|uniref:ATP-dependent DNA helicase CHL1 n=1 Tax=Aplosporella prunicola CBS 121167 TaxID=1176127 RepID=A0A6A6BSG0_9PEZI|nr:uncharacterized protein K452DRAFT_330380 [Aplosporella prunicola CBS 121167]KAF2147016.1 hypothetical protein K452DRAFT_330380 [Aplosporella prunicola CBS 121167]
MERDFHHPFQPYAIQMEFMNALYECIEQGKVGIFESPTGTGKSLSLICGSLTWLRDHKRKTFEEGLFNETADDDEPEWMLEAAREEKRRAALQQGADLEERLAKIRAKERKLKEWYESGEPHHKRQEADEARFLLEDYESDDDTETKKRSQGASDLGLSAETEALMKKLGLPLGKSSAEEDTEAVDELKVFYCSRTHSQLTQFSNELRRVKIPPAISARPADRARSTSAPEIEVEVEQEFKHLTLGSRKNLCINPKVAKLDSAPLINERCLDLQKPGTAADHKCPFLPTKETEHVVNDFRDHALAQIRDIEDLGAIGKKLGICPYYASRSAVKPSEIVTLPYPLLLQKSAREALDINMKNHIVIIDEAHNLMDAITGIYSVSVSLAQLQRSRAQLTIYLQKFRNKLKGKNRVYVAQTVRLLDSLIGYLQTRVANSKEQEGVVQIGDMMTGKGVDQINLYKLARYLQESKLARKVDGYIVHAEEEQQKNEKGAQQSRGGVVSAKQTKTAMPVLSHIQSFLLALMNPSAEGRFFFARDDDELGTCLKYMLLDPSHHFREIVEEARAVILAGGTMSPMSDYTSHLLPHLPSSRISTLSCGHVIPASNLLAVPVTHGASGAPLDFTFGARSSARTISDLGAALLAFVATIPDGVVVFFPSYAYLAECVAAWKRRDAGQGRESIWERLQKVKPVFMEAKAQSAAPSSGGTSNTPASTATASSGAAAAAVTSTDSVLAAYTAAVTTGGGRGALLLAVVGGTLSEGINFNDALGRGVMVVGLPFPNARSAEWVAKLEYVSEKSAAAAAAAAAKDKTAAKTGGSDTDAGKAAARDFYENACMRAVNQCVGRAIRHRGDYAAILLLDRRYAGERVARKLPGWIRGSLRAGMGVEGVKGELGGFFRGRG